jgi:hypothetical protein
LAAPDTLTTAPHWSIASLGPDTPLVTTVSP